MVVPHGQVGHTPGSPLSGVLAGYIKGSLNGEAPAPSLAMATYIIKNAQSPSATPENLPTAAFKPIDVDGATTKRKRKVAISEFKNGAVPPSIRLHGVLTTQGLNNITHEEWGSKWSFGLELNDAADVTQLEKWGSAEHLATVFQLPPGTKKEDVETLPLFKDEVLYVKVPVSKDGKTFLMTSNQKMTPKKPPTELFQGMPTDVYVNLLAYYSVAEEDTPARWGLTIRAKHADFWTELGGAAAEEMDPTPTPPPTPAQ